MLKHGRTMAMDLHRAAMDGRTAEVISLLNGGANVDAPDFGVMNCGVWFAFDHFLVPFFRVPLSLILPSSPDPNGVMDGFIMF